MTTPAVNLNQKQIIDATTDLYAYGSVWYTIHTETVQHEKQESRPESVSHPKTKSGWRNPGDWSHYVHVATTTPGNRVILGNPETDNFWTIYNDGVNWSNGVYGVPAFPTWLENSAVNKALLKLKNQSVDLSVAFGERKETGDLAIKAVSLTADAISAALNWKKGVAKSGSKLTQAGNRLWQQLKHETPKTIKMKSKLDHYGRGFIDNFLEVQYGVRPLKMDCYGAVSALNAKESDGNPYYAAIKANGRDNEDTIWYRASGFDSAMGYNVHVAVSHRCHVSLFYECDMPLYASLSKLGITNPASTAYELLPFSFVLDWFLPVGNYLSAMDATVGWSFRSGTITTVTKMTASSPTPTGSGSGFRILSGVPYSESGTRFQREVLSSSPGPRFPSFKNPLSGQHVANAIALVVSVFL